MSTGCVAPGAAALAVALLAALRRQRHPRCLRQPQQPTTAPRPAAPSTDAWATMLDSIAHHVRTGASLQHAFERAIAEHRVDGAVIRPNVSLSTALGSISPDPDEAVVLHSLTVAHALGGPVSSGLQAGASVLRERAAIRADIAVHSAQARLSARVLTAVPVVFFIWGIAASRSFRSAAGTPIGLAFAASGTALNVVGWVSMRLIIDRAGR